MSDLDAFKKLKDLSNRVSLAYRNCDDTLSLLQELDSIAQEIAAVAESLLPQENE